MKNIELKLTPEQREKVDAFVSENVSPDGRFSLISQPFIKGTMKIAFLTPAQSDIIAKALIECNKKETPWPRGKEIYIARRVV